MTNEVNNVKNKQDMGWNFAIFQAAQCNEQYRHLDNIRERYFSIWLGLATFLIAGTIAYYTTAKSPSDIVLRSFGFAYFIIWILGELFTLMGIQIRSTQVREAKYIIEMRNEVVRNLGRDVDLPAMLARLTLWRGLCSKLHILNYNSSTITLIFTIGELSALMLAMGLSFLRLMNTFWWIIALLVLVVAQFFAIRAYLQFLEGRFKEVVDETNAKIKAEPFNIDDVIKTTQKNPDSN